jgi:hypothetical protein
VVSVSPIIIGAGVEAVGDLSVERIPDGVKLTNRCVHLADEDVLPGCDVQPTP